MRILIAVAALSALGPAVARAQSAADTAAVVQVTRNVFDAMRKRDTTLLRSTFAPEARMITAAAARDGSPRVQVETPDAFVAAVGKPSEAVWDERTYGTEVRIDGNLATVWMEYDFYLGETFSHCGVDAFQLARYAEGWKIVSLADTRQRQGCPTRN